MKTDTNITIDGDKMTYKGNQIAPTTDISTHARCEYIGGDGMINGLLGADAGLNIYWRTDCADGFRRIAETLEGAIAFIDGQE
jgi:hypothetical protein